MEAAYAIWRIRGCSLWEIPTTLRHPFRICDGCVPCLHAWNVTTPIYMNEMARGGSSWPSHRAEEGWLCMWHQQGCVERGEARWRSSPRERNPPSLCIMWVLVTGRHTVQRFTSHVLVSPRLGFILHYSFYCVWFEPVRLMYVPPKRSLSFLSACAFRNMTVGGFEIQC